MKKLNKAALIVLALTLIASALCLAACNQDVTLTFDGNGATGGTVPAAITQSAGSEITLPTDVPQKTDYQFYGWSDGGKNVYQAGETFVLTESITLTAVWTKPLFTAPVNTVILHDGQKTKGEMMLFDDGTGYVNIVNKTSGLAVLSYVEFSYTVMPDGVFTITQTTEESKLQLPAVGSIVGNRVSVTLTNGSVSGSNVDFEFISEIYKLSVDYGYGSLTQESLLPAGYQMDLSQVSEREDYELTGLTVNSEDKTLDWAKTFTMPNSDTAVVYKWTKIVKVDYTVTYKAGEGEGEDYTDKATSQIYKLLFNTKTNFTREGYKFGGWLVNGQKKSTGESITLMGDLEVTAIWNKSYKVTYANVNLTGVETNVDVNDPLYTEFTADTYYLPYGSRQAFAPALAYYSRSGFVLEGWLSSADNGTDKAGKIYAAGDKYVLSQDTTFTAVWDNGNKFAKYEGKYENKEGLAIDSLSYNFTQAEIKGSQLILTDDGEETKVTLTSASATTATGKIGTFDVTVEFAAAQITVSVKVQSQTHSGVFTKIVPTDKTLADYAGFWKGEIDFNNCSYVLAEVKDGTITFSEDLNNGYLDEFTLKTDASAKNLVATFTKSSTIQGTITFTADDKFTLKVQITDNRTGTKRDVTAQFTKTQAYTVSFGLGDGYQGTSSPIASQTVISGVLVVKPTDPVWEGYKFLGWFAGSATSAYDFTSPVTADLALVAKWQQLTQVTVSFNLNGGTGSVPAQTVPYNTAATEPQTDPQYAGYRFEGWFVRLTDKTPFDFATPVKEDMMLVAKWSREYSVTFVKPQGATGETPEAVKVYAGDTYTFPENPYQMTDCQFLGWKFGAVMTLYPVGTQRQVNNNITLTAVFGNTYTDTQSNTLVLRSDGNAYWMEEFYSYNVLKDGTIKLSDQWGTEYFFETDGSSFAKLDDLRSLEFTAKDGAKLTFDGKGGAMLGETPATYTVTYNEYGLCGFVLTYQGEQYPVTIELDMDLGAYVINVNIGSHVFGTPAVVYTVTYELGEGVTGTAPAQTTVTADADGNATVTLAGGGGIAKEGFTFAGWTVKGGDAVVYKTTYTATGDVTFVSAWTEGSSATGSKLIDYAGASASAPVTYGYASVDAAGSDTLNIGSTKIFKIDFYWSDGYTSGFIVKRYWNTTSSTSQMKDESYSVTLSDKEMENATIATKISGVTIKFTFGTNDAGLRTVSVQVETANGTGVFNDPVVWTEMQ
ncbi:MAG: InlB B-repeat-containing protein [Corallococcus sp.]|nr:InlB B-repeat-containing protein [Corallococcus sp.]